jgi:alginate O-acetyltransferase complex protein AlgI
MTLVQHPIFDVLLPSWWRYIAQMPPGVTFYIFPALIGLLVPQRWIRSYLLVTSILMVWLTFGYWFFFAISGAVLVGWGLCLIARAARRYGPGPTRLALLGGWGIANAIYFPMFWLPVNRLLENSTQLDILLLCGPAFLLIRVLGLLSDICRGEQVGSLRLDRFALFLLYAPTFRLGPMTRYAALNEQIDQCKSQVNRPAFLNGILKILLGVGMLMLVNKIIDKQITRPYHEYSFFYLRGIYDAAPHLTFAKALMAMYMIAFRFLLGFGGYSQIAIGLSLLLGIKIPGNFNWPYLAVNLQDFWRRWHITLGTWLRDYVYIPLGGRDRRMFGTFAVFLYCFMWHQPALNMLIFGCLHAGGLIFLHTWQKSFLFRTVQKIQITQGPLGAVLGGLITFHFWCLTLLILFDPDHCGMTMLKRILVDPFRSSF